MRTVALVIPVSLLVGCEQHQTADSDAAAQVQAAERAMACAPARQEDAEKLAFERQKLAFERLEKLKKAEADIAAYAALADAQAVAYRSRGDAEKARASEKHAEDLRKLQARIRADMSGMGFSVKEGDKQQPERRAASLPADADSCR